jgi:hypothetical protein
MLNGSAPHTHTITDFKMTRTLTKKGTATTYNGLLKVYHLTNERWCANLLRKIRWARYNRLTCMYCHS